MTEEGNHLSTLTRSMIVHVYNVHIVCGYGMLTSSNESKTITNMLYVQGIHKVYSKTCFDRTCHVKGCLCIKCVCLHMTLPIREYCDFGTPLLRDEKSGQSY